MQIFYNAVSASKFKNLDRRVVMTKFRCILAVVAMTTLTGIFPDVAKAGYFSSGSFGGGFRSYFPNPVAPIPNYWSNPGSNSDSGGYDRSTQSPQPNSYVRNRNIPSTYEEALKRLESVPVFAVTNKEGVPILASIPNPKNKSKNVQIATFFVDPQDALSLIETLRNQKPDVGNSARVVVLSMRQAYDIKNKNKNKAESLMFEFLPSKQQTESAITVLKQNGQNVSKFNDIPLFYGTGGDNKGLLIIEQSKNKVIPFYFDKQDLLGMLDQLRQKNPRLSNTIKIEVTSLSKVFESLSKDNSPAMQQVTLVPERAALQFALHQLNNSKR